MQATWDGTAQGATGRGLQEEAVDGEEVGAVRMQQLQAVGRLESARTYLVLWAKIRVRRLLEPDCCQLGVGFACAILVP